MVRKMMLGMLCWVWMCGTAAVFAQKTDAASDAVYDPSWDSGDNGGTGFGSWSLNINGNAGHFVGSSTGNGNGDTNADGDINSSGKAWGMYANSGGLSEAFRSIISPLGAGTSFSIDMDNGFIDNGSTVGLALQNDAGTNLFEFLFIGGGSEYIINDNTGIGRSTGLGFTDEGLQLSFTFSTGNNYSVQITRLEGGNATVSGTLADTPTKFRIFNANAGAGSTNDLFFNNLSVNDPERPAVALNTAAAGSVSATLTDNSRIASVEVKSLSGGASVTVGGIALSQGQTQNYSAPSLALTASGSAGQNVRLVITDAFGNRLVWTYEFQ